MKRLKIRKQKMRKSTKENIIKPQSNAERLGLESKSGILGMIARGGIKR